MGWTEMRRKRASPWGVAAGTLLVACGAAEPSEAPLPESASERGFDAPAELRIRAVDREDGSALAAHVYVLPDVEDPELYDRTLQRLGHEKHYWYGEGGDFSYSSRPTDDQGLLVTAVPSGVGLEVEASGRTEAHGSGRIAVAPLAPGEVRAVHVPVPSGPNRSFFGRVTADGAPVAGAEVELLEWGLPTGAVERSGADGCFRAEVRDWRRPQALVRAPDRGPVLVNLVEEHATRPTACPLALPPAAELVLELAPEGELVLAAELPEEPYAIHYHIGFLGGGWRREATSRGGELTLEDLPVGVPIELTLDGRRMGELTLAAGSQRRRWTGKSLQRVD